MKKLLLVILSLVFSTIAYAQTNTNVMSRIRDATDQTQVAAVNVGSAAITGTTAALTTRSLLYGWDWLADNRWERVMVDSNGFLVVNATTATPAYTRIESGLDATTAYVLNNITDALALTTNTLATVSAMMVYNGATLDMARSGASGGLIVEVVTRAWEDLANGWVNVKKSATGTYAPAKTTTANIGVAATVLASVEILGYPNCTVTLRNVDAADPFTDAAVYVSADNAGTCGDANWVSLSWVACDALTATNTCTYTFTSNSYRYMCVQVTGAVGNEVSVDAWLTCSVN